MALLDDEVLSLHIAEIPQSLLKSRSPALVLISRVRREKADLPNLSSLLGLGGERRGQKADGENDREPDQPHRAPRWRTTAGESSRTPRHAPAGLRTSTSSRRGRLRRRRPARRNGGAPGRRPGPRGVARSRFHLD